MPKGKGPKPTLRGVELKIERARFHLKCLEKAFSGLVECWLRSTDDYGVSLPHLVELFSCGH